MKNAKNKKDTILYIITPLLLLNLILNSIDKFPVLRFINGLALLIISIYALILPSQSR